MNAWEDLPPLEPFPTAEEITAKYGKDHPACMHEGDSCENCHPDCRSEIARCGCGDF